MSCSTFITLATFNGAPFLARQIESLQGQTLDDWILLIRDDGSTDGTREIAADFAAADPRITLIEDTVPEARRAAGNFSMLLSSAFERGARYVFSCDQDDVWRPDKIARVLEGIKVQEGDGRTPVLLHHDLAVVDAGLRPIARSYWSMMQIIPGDERRPQRLFSRNEVTGCAMACNRALLEIALPIPPQAIMHDWWLALCAAHFGTLRHLPDQLVQYRQHERNVIGAKSFWSGLNPAPGWFATWRKGNSELIDTVRQAAAFHARYGNRLEPTAAAAAGAYCEILQAGRLRRFDALQRSDAWRRHWLLDATLILRLLSLKAPD